MSVLDLFFPRQVKCMFCRRETTEFGICSDCYEYLPFIESPICHNCGESITGKGKVCIECKGRFFCFDRCYSVLHYVDEIKKKIISFKQGGCKYLGYDFAWLIEKKYKDITEDIDMIILVPISNDRLKDRGFNQSEVLCAELLSTGKVNTNILQREKDTPHQTGLSRENRTDNLKDAFVVKDKKNIKDKTILLVDDIYTTGSTLSECARILKDKGAKSVIGLCLARSPINKDRIVKNLKYC